MFEFFDKKKKPVDPDNSNFHEIHINMENIEKQMDDLMKDMMSSQNVQPGKPNFFSVSIKIDKNGNKTIKKSNDVPQDTQNSQEQMLKFNEPLSDVHDLKNKFSVIADLQGMTEKDVKINVEKEHILTINANDGQRSFAKKVELPSLIDEKSLKANFKNGILEITLNKKK
ncbi:MAG: hypothetical protein COT15_04430 [Candidatus Diapherotrites archaeon CG08_land_8_20_14_0_20_34_12]|nr:MAG: hypothetical protein COT15_04430 [Candidatus Diapherotrites archaeon CG08_land_8_20_14_0_20_34_12]